MIDGVRLENSMIADGQQGNVIALGRQGVSRFALIVVMVVVAIPLLTIGFGVAGLVRSMDPTTQGPSLEPIQEEETNTKESEQKDNGKLKVATFGAGCFWCVEAVFQELDGVHSVKSGYTGGHVENPTYEQICSKTTGHAEVCRIEYDPEKITFKELLEVFWKTHDPTTLNRQGNDSGPQYRSAIFYHDSEQKELATKYKKRLDESGAFGRPIVTEITEASKFWPCEQYHDNYFKLNPNAGYCRFIIQPKVEKFKKAFGDKLKKSSDK